MKRTWDNYKELEYRKLLDCKKLLPGILDNIINKSFYQFDTIISTCRIGTIPPKTYGIITNLNKDRCYSVEFYILKQQVATRKVKKDQIRKISLGNKNLII